MAGVIIAGFDEIPEEQEFINVSDTPVDLFDETSDTPHSAVFTVPGDGSGILLSAFGNCCDLTVAKVKVPADDMPSAKGACCHPSAVAMVGAPRITGADTVDQSGGSWSLNISANTGVLTLPGTYIVYVCDEDCLGGFSLCAQKIQAAAINNLPRQLIFGYEGASPCQ